MRTTILTILLLGFAPGPAVADEISEEKKALIDEVLEITGALKIAETMSNMIVEQMTRSLQSADSEIPGRAFELMEETVNRTLREEMESGSFHEMLYPVYDKYLSVAELEAMVRFYSTEEGRRIIAVMPAMTQEAMVAGQQWGRRLGPAVATEVNERLTAEGYDVR